MGAVSLHGVRRDVAQHALGGVVSWHCRARAAHGAVPPTTEALGDGLGRDDERVLQRAVPQDTG